MEINNITLDEAREIKERLERKLFQLEMSDHYDSREIAEVEKDIAFIDGVIEKLEVKND